jgi:tRNA(Arg) A34 adenosine deaminase TadA
MLGFDMGAPKPNLPEQKLLDELRMMDLVRFTARTLVTGMPVPFGAQIVETDTGDLVMRAVNAVRVENDPSSHAELRTVRRAARKLKSPSLKGHTLYTTCEPCPMCMANALWAGIDRVVYGATIADANRHCRQIRVPAREIVQRSDMECIVEGPVLRNACYELFKHPSMLKAFATWNPKTPKPLFGKPLR